MSHTGCGSAGSRAAPVPGGFYERGYPGQGDALLLIEVFESSLEYDRNVKLPLYAGYGIPEVWIVDLSAGEIESHSVPRHGAYGFTRRYHRGDELISESVSGLRLNVAGILGGELVYSR